MAVLIPWALLFKIGRGQIVETWVAINQLEKIKKILNFVILKDAYNGRANRFLILFIFIFYLF